MTIELSEPEFMDLLVLVTHVSSTTEDSFLKKCADNLCMKLSNVPTSTSDKMKSI